MEPDWIYSLSTHIREKKMKIAIIIYLFPPKWLAGTEIATYNLAKQLAKRGHEIHVITSHDRGLPNFDKENGFYIHRLAWSKIRIIGVIIFWLKIFFTVRKINPDIVHAQDLSTGIPAYISKIILKMPYIIWGRGSDVYLPNGFLRITRGVVLRNANAILALTEDMREKMREITTREIFVIPNGIDLEEFKGVLIKPDEYSTGKTILFVGSLYPIKGVEYLLIAMKKIHEKAPDTRLIIVGDGGEREKLEALTTQMGIQNSVQFVGRVPHKNVLNFMQRADIFVLPSLSEGLPNVIIEAMACGLPIVASRVGGIPDIIKDGVNGYVVDPGRPDQIANKILMLLNNNELVKQISNNNRRMVEIFEWRNIINKLEEIYNSALAPFPDHHSHNLVIV